MRKSYELQIWQIYSWGPSEQKPLKNLGGKGTWMYHGLPKFFEYPILSQEKKRVKLRTSNLAASMRTKVP